MESNRLINILDEDGDVDLTKGNILPLVSEQYLQKIIAKVNSKPEKNELEEIESGLQKKEDVAVAVEIDVIDLTEEDEEEENGVFQVNLPKNKISK